MKHCIQKTTCFLFAFALLLGTIFLTPVSVNAALKNIVKPQSWEVANGGEPVVKDMTLPAPSDEVYLLIGTNAPAACTIMIFNSEDMEVDSLQITETDASWAESENGIFINGYSGSFAAGDYHIALTFEKATAYQFSVVAEIPEAVISNTTLTLTAGFTKTLSVKDNTGSVKWKSSKPAIASVDSKGTVTAKKAGKSTITATVDGKQLKCTVTVKTNKYTASKLTNSEISYGEASWEAYSAAYNANGGLDIKFRMVNSSGHYSEYLKNIVVKVKTAKGSTAAVYKKAHFPLYVSDQSYKDFKITIPKSDLKIKKTIDLRNASIQTDGKYGYTYYSY